MDDKTPHKQHKEACPGKTGGEPDQTNHNIETGCPFPAIQQVSLGQPPPVESQNDPTDASALVEACAKIREQVGRVVVGQDSVIEQLLIAILALATVAGRRARLAKTLVVHTLPIPWTLFRQSSSHLT